MIASGHAGDAVVDPIALADTPPQHPYYTEALGRAYGEAIHEFWKALDARLKEIMLGIHATCVKHGADGPKYINYVKGANIGGFVKVADAMLAQGLI